MAKLSPKLDKESDLTPVIVRLDTIINLLLESLNKEDKPMGISKRIEILSTTPLRPSDISRIIGKPIRDVTSAMSKHKKRTKKSN